MLTAELAADGEGELSEVLKDILQEVHGAEPTKSPKSLTAGLNDVHKNMELLRGMDVATKQPDINRAAQAMMRAAEKVLSTGDDGLVGGQGLLDVWENSIDLTEGISTGIRTFDEKMQGGFNRGDLVLVMGMTGMGKSSLAVHFGHAAVKSGWRVAHFDSENGRDVTMYRYYARLNEEPTKAFILQRSQKKLEFWYRQERKRLEQHLRVWGFEVGQTELDAIRGKIREMSADGFRPDVIIIDQPDHLKIDNRNTAYETKRIWDKMKGWASSLGAVVIAVTQAKDAENKIATVSHVGWGVDKIRAASVAFSVNAGPSESQRILYVVKMRHGSARYAVLCDADMAFCKFGEIEMGKRTNQANGK